jgi:hypothetical protein
MEPQIEQNVVVKAKNKIGEKTIQSYGDKFKIQAIADRLSFDARKGTWLRLHGTTASKPIYSFWLFYEDDNNFTIELKEKYNAGRK